MSPALTDAAPHESCASRLKLDHVRMSWHQDGSEQGVVFCSRKHNEFMHPMSKTPIA